MPILTFDELAQYHGRRISGIKPGNGIGRRAYARLLAAEEALDGCEGGFPYLIAARHHLDGEGISSLAEEFGLPRYSLNSMLEYFGIPRMTKQEALKRIWKDPGFRERHAEGVRRGRYGAPISKEQARRVRESYLENLGRARGTGNLVSVVAEESGVEKEYVAAYLERLGEAE